MLAMALQFLLHIWIYQPQSPPPRSLSSLLTSLSAARPVSPLSTAASYICATATAIFYYSSPLYTLLSRCQCIWYPHPNKKVFFAYIAHLHCWFDVQRKNKTGKIRYFGTRRGSCGEIANSKSISDLICLSVVEMQVENQYMNKRTTISRKRKLFQKYSKNNLLMLEMVVQSELFVLHFHVVNRILQYCIIIRTVWRISVNNKSCLYSLPQHSSNFVTRNS